MTTRVCVGAIVGAHGVRGQVRVKSFTDDPADVAAYGPVESEDGKRRFGLKVVGQSKGLVIAWIDGVTDRNAAEAMKGTRFFVPRDRLPEPEEDEFFYSDLAGLIAFGVDGAEMGRVRGVANFGAGEVLEIQLRDGGSIMVPFTKACVPQVDVAKGRLVVDPPSFAEEDEDDQGGAER
ncbi:ribosome maturation factor RimM [Magnetospirillum sp. LM-5]|uniref:ribosome maturation factor RimM n=1 Tax=Magnetospirillum sp. LM-5 TaxID=2681466 RepID=UPI0015708AF1|nr:ribosome maturation factor RimM [Magnetospirillum sp. LM-5]